MQKCGRIVKLFNGRMKCILNLAFMWGLITFTAQTGQNIETISYSDSDFTDKSDYSSIVQYIQDKYFERVLRDTSVTRRPLVIIKFTIQ